MENESINGRLSKIDPTKGPLMFVLIGMPASGKSTWRAAYLGYRNGTTDRSLVILSTDDIVERIAAENGVTYDEAFDLVSMKDREREMKANFAEALERGDDIIVDRTNLSVASRNKFISRGRQSKHNYQAIGVVFDVSPEELERRRNARHEAEGKSIPQQHIDDMVSRYEAPRSDEFDFIIKGN